MRMLMTVLLAGFHGAAMPDVLPPGWPENEDREYELLMDFDAYAQCNHAYQRRHARTPGDAVNAVIESGEWRTFTDRVDLLLASTRYAPMAASLESLPPFDKVLLATQLVAQAAVSDQVDDRERIQFLSLAHHAMSNSTNAECEMPASVRHLIESIGD